TALTSANNDSAIRWKLSGEAGDDPTFYSTLGVRTASSGDLGSPGWVRHHNEGYTAGPSCLGECCLPDGSCTVTFDLDCTTNGCGDFQPEDADCVTNPPTCSFDTEACCTEAGDCFDFTLCECAQIGGSPQGFGTDCQTSSCPVLTGVILNEIDYDNPGTDTDEFIEVLGPQGTDLTGWSIELYEGNDGALDNTIALTGSIPVDDRFYVLGSATVTNVDQLFDFATNNVENGPDGIALCNGTTPVELIAYEGTFNVDNVCGSGQTQTPMPNIGDDAGRGGSIQKIPSGGVWTETPSKTPGETNVFFDDTCRDIATAKALGSDIGVRLCDVVVSTRLDMSGTADAWTFYVQDGSGTAGEARGIAVFGNDAEIEALIGPTGSPIVIDGDQIDLLGTTSQFFETFELASGEIPLELDAIDGNVGVPAATPVSVLDMQDSSPRAEELESVLVELSCVSFVDAGASFAGAANYDVTDDGILFATIRIATTDLDLVGTTIPSGFVNVSGIVTQFNQEYNIRPPSLAHLDTGGCPSPPTGSCCTDDPVPLTCVEGVTFLECEALANGSYQGNGETCDPNPCLPQGTCCLATGACTITDENDCIAEGGTWNGDPPIDCAQITCDVTADLAINEIRIDQPGNDDDEYFELNGDPGLSLLGLTYLVIGDGTGGSGTIEAVVDLTGSAIPVDGYFLAAEDNDTFGAAADLQTSLNFENSDNVTHVLVVGFVGSNGDDLDIDDDGVLDVTPWAAIHDLIALVEEENPPVGTEFHYGDSGAGTAIGPDGTFVPGHVFRLPNGSGPWQIGSFDPATGNDTPGEANVELVLGGACCLAGGACSDVADEAACTTAGGTYAGDTTECASTGCVDVGASCNNNVEPRFCGVNKLLLDFSLATDAASLTVDVSCVDNQGLPVSYTGVV
ncbi:MAG: hypothetical protein ACYSVY_24150, partial [Planctomycetota bacterium]